MRRGWFLALALSLGLNAGLLWVHFTGRGLPAAIPGPPFLEHRAERGPERPPRDPERLVEMHLRRMGGQLDLTAEQRTAIGNVLRERLPRLVELRERLMEARRDAAQAYRARPLDGPRFRERVQVLRGLQADLDSVTAEVMLKEAELLTPAQRERYAEVMPWGFDRGGPGGPDGHRRPGGRTHRPGI
jgi:Spy/CpxP family protein refolding chaperone